MQLAEDVEFFCADSCRGCIFFLLLLLSCSWLVQLKTIFMLNVLFSIAEELVQHWYVWCLKYFVTNKLWGFFVTRHYSTQLLHINFVHLWALEFQKESVSLKHIISLWGWTIQDCQELAFKGLQHLKKHFWHITAHSITCLTKSEFWLLCFLSVLVSELLIVQKLLIRWCSMPLLVVFALAGITKFLNFSLIFLTSDGQSKPVTPVRETEFCAVQLLWDCTIWSWFWELLGDMS